MNYRDAAHTLRNALYNVMEKLPRAKRGATNWVTNMTPDDRFRAACTELHEAAKGINARASIALEIFPKVCPQCLNDGFIEIDGLREECGECK